MRKLSHDCLRQNGRTELREDPDFWRWKKNEQGKKKKREREVAIGRGVVTSNEFYPKKMEY